MDHDQVSQFLKLYRPHVFQPADVAVIKFYIEKLDPSRSDNTTYVSPNLWCFRITIPPPNSYTCSSIGQN